MEWDPNKNPGRVPIGGKPNRKNQKVQAKANAETKKRTEAESSSQATNELTFQEMLGIVDTIVKDWSAEGGDIIGYVMNQKAKDICWAICFVRLVQALHNIGRPINQHVLISVTELISHIKPCESENFGLANLKIAINHIAKNGILKEPTTSKRSQQDNAQGMRFRQTFHLYEDVDASFIQTRLDRYPVALLVQVDSDFSNVGKAGVYYLPKKQNITENSRLHSMLLIGYGVTKEGKTYFIGQNSYGEKWGCKAYAIIFIEDNCDIFCKKE